MNASAPLLSPAEAAARLGISTKALRLYEDRGLLNPVRSASGWRHYSGDHMQRAREIVVLRGFGLSLTQISRVLDGDGEALASALGEHQARLEGEARMIGQTLDRVRAMRGALDGRKMPAHEALTTLADVEPAISFKLPWPWGGEWFEMKTMCALTYIVGPLGSGKTRLALRLAETIPGARFLGLDRAGVAGRAGADRLDADADLRDRVTRVLGWLEDDGATPSAALRALLVGLEDGDHSVIMVDLVEDGLDKATQQALVAWMRSRRPDACKLMVMTRSSAVLDLGAVGTNEAIIFCPANHSPPVRVWPYPGAPGYEALMSCLATPDVRARTEGVVAVRRPEHQVDGDQSRSNSPG